MMYRVVYDVGVKKDIRNIDKTSWQKIKKWIDENLQGCSEPRLKGKPLTGDMKGLWRYRVGNYRIIARIDDEHLEILAVRIAHRGKVYR